MRRRSDSWRFTHSAPTPWYETLALAILCITAIVLGYELAHALIREIAWSAIQ